MCFVLRCITISVFFVDKFIRVDGVSVIVMTEWQPYEERQKDKAKQRDDYMCQNCGMTQEEHCAKDWGHPFWNGTGLHVHHVKRQATFDDGEDPHRLSNLETLCLKCHSEESAHSLPFSDNIG